RQQRRRPGKIRSGRSSSMPPRQRAAAAAIADDEPAAIAIDGVREFAFSEADFRHLAQVAYDYAGIALAASKQNLVYSRLSRRLRALGLSSFQQYRDHLAESEREIESFINSISTNHTKFFRESHHLDHFRTHVSAAFTQATHRGDPRFRIWFA